METWARNSRFTPAEVTNILNEPTKWTSNNPYMAFHPGQVLRVVIAVGLNRARLGDAYNALRGRDPRTRAIHPDRRDAELTKLQQGQALVLNPLHWDEFLKVLERAGFRNKSMITSTSTILYSYALWLIGRKRFQVPVDELREVMASWFFMSQITGRYTSSPETRMQEELNRLDGLPETAAEFTKVLNSQIDAAVPADWWTVTLPDALDTSSVKSPAWVAYVAALNILDADVLLANSKVKDWINPNRTTVKGIEKHYLFPKGYLKKHLGFRSVRKINQVANYALVEWSDNISISDDAPTTYWPTEVANKNIDDTRRRRQEGWHALPDGWTSLNYDEFLHQRRRLIARVTYQAWRRLTNPNYEPDLTRHDADTDGDLNPLLLPPSNTSSPLDGSHPEPSWNPSTTPPPPPPKSPKTATSKSAITHARQSTSLHAKPTRTSSPAGNTGGHSLTATKNRCSWPTYASVPVMPARTPLDASCNRPSPTGAIRRTLDR